MIALYFGQILTRWGVAVSKFSGWFVDFFPVNLLLVRAQQIAAKRFYPRGNTQTWRGWEFNRSWSWSL